MLQINIFDADNFDSDDHVDTINVLIPRTVNLSSVFSPRQSYSGTCGRATIELSYRLTSNCPANRYGPSCTRLCIPQSGQYYCNYIGNRVCLGTFTGQTCTQCIQNYYGSDCNIFCSTSNNTLMCDGNGMLRCRGNFVFPDCTECLPDYYGINCDTFCVPHNNASGHYNCSNNGDRICIERYDILPDCLSCELNYFGDSCSVLCIPPTARHICVDPGVPVCMRGFAPPNCTECLPDYYGINCDTFCVPHNNASGHYNCSDNGDRICIEHYDELPNCLSCEPNYFGDSCSVLCTPTTVHICSDTGVRTCRLNNFALPDCTSCLPNFQGTNCNDCTPNYFPPGDCNVHCIPQDSTSGHFTCDPRTGAIRCLSGFTDTQTNCTTEGKLQIVDKT